MRLLRSRYLFFELIYTTFHFLFGLIKLPQLITCHDLTFPYLSQ